MVVDPADTTMEQNSKSDANAIRVLSNLGFNMTLEVILEAVNLSSTLNIGVDEMLGPEFHVALAEREAERRSQSKRKG
ncbi:Exosome complex component RRP4 homolog [Linum perenne]